MGGGGSAGGRYWATVRSTSSANLLWAGSLAYVLLLVTELAIAAPRASRPVIAPTSWDVIGPFPASAREQGADALSAFAPEGVLGLPRGGDAMYPSELASEWAGREAGKVGWSVVEPSADDGVTVNIDFGDMRWDFMQAPFGSSVRRATGWAIGDFDTQIQPGTYAVVCQGVSWFLLDGDRINGDIYRTGWRGIQPVMLQAGQHTLHVPFTTSGSTGSFSCSVSLYETDTDEQPLEAVLREGEGGRPFLFADLVGESGAAERTLASTAGSVVVENRGVDVLHDFYAAVLSNDGSGEPSPDFALTISPHSPIVIQPRQQLPLRFDMEQLQPVTCGSNDYYPMRILVRAFIIDIPPSPKRHHAHDGSQHKTLNGTTSLKRQPVEMTVSFNLTCREYGEAFVFTFPDADETVQYAAARSPSEPCPPNGCAVMFSTHGAGVDADPRRNSAWAGAYRRQEQAWLLWPTNRDDFGYDWQMIGYQNGMKALEYLVDNLPGVPSQAGNRADPNRLLYSGHSMGGHGCLEYLTHHGDRALGAVPAAGWISMELYTFDRLRTGDGWIDPTLRGVLYSALGEWDTDLYVSNAVGIPLLMRLGGNDTSVPPWHLRRFARLLDQASTEPLAVGISEVAGEGHWWDSIMDDDVIAPFYAAALQQDGLPSLPRIVEVVTLNPATTTGRGGTFPVALLLPLFCCTAFLYLLLLYLCDSGVRIEQLRTPYRLARASIDRGEGDGTEGPWVIVTQNVRRLSFYSLPSRPLPAAGVVIDGSVFIGSPPAEGNGAHYCISEPAPAPCTVPGVGTCNAAEAASEPPIWRLCDGDDGTDWTLTERSASNYGPLRQVFHTAQIFLIYGTGSSDVAYNDLMRERARFIANTAYYQGRAAITILDDMHPLVDQLLASDEEQSNVRAAVFH